MRDIIICDIDGTIADLTHRRKYLEQTPKDYNSFFATVGEDKPIWPIIRLLNVLGYGLSCYFVSGRSEVCREATEEWLEEYVQIPYEALYMRPEGNHRPDWLIKQRILDKHFIETGLIERVAYVLDDRDSVVQMWRKNGLTCLQVANGDF